MNEPNGKDLMALLIDLLADQYNVHIKYELEGKNDDDAINANDGR